MKQLAGTLPLASVPYPAREAAAAPAGAAPTTYVWGPYTDFWALGGASIFLWLLLLAGDFFRGQSPAVTMRMGQVAVVFSLLSVFVNYPHFMISYKFGYGRGPRFVLRHWAPLVAVPLALVAAFAAAYFWFDYDVSACRPLVALDALLAPLGIDLGVKDRGGLGREVLQGSIWLMYFTVGWHYSKQVFGCLMVYAKLRGYALSAIERGALKWNLLAVAVYQFVYMNHLLAEAGAGAAPRFPGMTLSGFALPGWVQAASGAALVATTLGALAVFARITADRRRLPDVNFLVAWLSFLIWWVPVKSLPEFYAMAVPFFHSLQYLLFAAKLENSSLGQGRHAKTKMIAVVALTVLLGVAGFELVPAALDASLGTSTAQTAWFFMTVAAVFLNVHHFFIDSVVWKFHHREVRDAFFP